MYRRLLPALLAFGFLAVLSMGASLRPAEAEEKLSIEALRSYLTSLQAAAKERDPAALGAAFDLDAMLAEWERLGFFRSTPEAQKATVLQAVRARLRRAVLEPTFVPPFASFEIRSLRAGPTPDTHVAYVRLRYEDGSVAKMWFHLKLRAGRLGLYDLEDLDTGFGFAAIVGSLLVDSTVGGRAGWREAVDRTQQAQAQATEGAFEEAYAHLSPAQALELPDVLQSMVQLMLAACSLGSAEFDLSIEHANRAQALKSDAPILHFIRAVAWNALGQHDQALSAVRTYIAQVDEDPQINLEWGKALHGLGRRAEALAPLRKALAEPPVDYEALAYLALCLPVEGSAEIAALYARLPDAAADFAAMAEICLEAEDARVLRLLTDLHAKAHAQDFQVPYYRGMAALLEADLPAAERHLRAALDRVASVDIDRDEKDLYLEAWLDVMAGQGKHLVAFDTAPDRSAAFLFLAEDLALDQDADRLHALVDRATSIETLLPWRRYYGGEVHFLRKQYDQAVAVLTPLRVELRQHAEEDEDLLYLLWDTEDRLLRAAVRTSAADLEEALAIAREVAARDQDLAYVLMVLAHQGKVKEAGETLVRAIEAGAEPERLFEDEDLRELLAGPAYQGLRTKYYEAR
jgi:tetratricopeptide (TPR) repeat protein